MVSIVCEFPSKIQKDAQNINEIPESLYAATNPSINNVKIFKDF